jgi:hypothetical protein
MTTTTTTPAARLAQVKAEWATLAPATAEAISRAVVTIDSCVVADEVERVSDLVNRINARVAARRSAG